MQHQPSVFERVAESGHYIVITDVPMLGSRSFRFAVADVDGRKRKWPAPAVDQIRAQISQTHITNYDLRRFNYELVVRVFYRP